MNIQPGSICKRHWFVANMSKNKRHTKNIYLSYNTSELHFHELTKSVLQTRFLF